MRGGERGARTLLLLGGGGCCSRGAGAAADVVVVVSLLFLKSFTYLIFIYLFKIVKQI